MTIKCPDKRFQRVILEWFRHLNNGLCISITVAITHDYYYILVQGGVDDSCQIKPNSTSRPQSVTLQCSLANVECSCGEQRRFTTGVSCEG